MRLWWRVAKVGKVDCAQVLALEVSSQVAEVLAPVDVGAIEIEVSPVWTADQLIEVGELVGCYAQGRDRPRRSTYRTWQKPRLYFLP